MLRTQSVTYAILATPLLAGFAVAAPEGWKPLLEPQELSSILSTEDDVRVVRVSGDADEGVIPGAVSAPYAEWRGPSENPGALREIDHYRHLVRSIGISADTPVVLVHQGSDPTDMGTAARVYWTLKSLGVEDLAILNGGFTAWREAGLEVQSVPATVEPSDWTPQWSEEWRVSTEEVERHVKAGDARLIDARPTGFFEGTLWTIAKPGTLPTAGNLTFETWFDGTRMVDAQMARDIAERYDQTDAPLTVSFCNTGHWASINWFALSEMAGVENTRLYAESMAEWTTADRPIANQPSTLTYYWLVTKRWVEGLFA